MDFMDEYNTRGREIARERADQEAANNRPRMDGSSPWARLLNRWILLAVVIGFPLGFMIESTPEGAFAGAIMLGGAAFVCTIIVILFRVTLGGAASGAGDLHRRSSGFLGGLPQWAIFGAVLGAAGGAGIAIWLDGNAADIAAPALRLAPIGAGAGFVLRAIVLGVGALRKR